MKIGSAGASWVTMDPKVKSDSLGFQLPSLPIGVDDILADDWEVQEPTVTITKTRFWSAYEGAKEEFKDQVCPLSSFDILLARKLGLE